MARSTWVALAGAAAIGTALLLTAAAPAGAQSFEAAAEPTGGINLTQRGIPAEASAENGVLARERALAAGRRIAWERLLAEAGQPGTSLSDQQIEEMVSSIVIEQERTAPTRYSGRITVNFSASRVRSALGRGSAGVAPIAGAGAAPAPAGPASNWVEAVATYHSMAEWLELHRRLKAAGPVASVSILGIAVDAARLRVGLRAPPQVAAADLAGLGVTLAPGGAAAGPNAGPAWRVGLAGGG
ncbi:hypothetical protein GCM10011504_07440 [Siccirubricoccus deserti]|uniref:DUF541 domain-containing protein n=1 Tax=Siccirubricoccus deserti TaxID=2013562 RepID=A0A9X0QV94_9PROT|nr:hypothetical protein [Siccirubricoccus deserti]MBC4014581.1 hypothetical protein [Siccirubricoccus deserti]GGC31712.1 hypothetical protein GCM10011504_07440 [Siccirubricoccus deserti]